MYKLQDMAQKDRENVLTQLKNDPTNPVLKQKSANVPNFRPLWDEQAKTVTFGFPNSDKPGAASACGSYTWRVSGDEPATYESYKRVALEQVVNTLAPAAKSVSYASDKTLSAAEQNQLRDRTVNAILGATADYENIMQPALKADTAADQKWRDSLIESKQKGWITAGSYYWDLASISNKLNDSNKKNYQPNGTAEVSDLKNYGVDSEK